MKVKIDINKILKDIGQDGNPAISLKAVQQVVDKVEFEFRNAGYGINDTEVKIIDINSTNDTIDLGYVPKFKKANPTSLKKGDLFLGFSVNCKGRPMVIAKIVKDMATNEGRISFLETLSEWAFEFEEQNQYTDWEETQWDETLEEFLTKNEDNGKK